MKNRNTVLLFGLRIIYYSRLSIWKCYRSSIVLRDSNVDEFNFNIKDKKTLKKEGGK